MHAFHRECAFEFAKLQKIICVCKLICENYKENPQVLKSRVYVEVYDRYMLAQKRCRAKRLTKKVIIVCCVKKQLTDDLCISTHEK